MARGHRSHAFSFSKEWGTNRSGSRPLLRSLWSPFEKNGGLIPVARGHCLPFSTISFLKNGGNIVIAVHAGGFKKNNRGRVEDGGRSARKSALEG